MSLHLSGLFQIKEKFAALLLLPPLILAVSDLEAQTAAVLELPFSQVVDLHLYRPSASNSRNNFVTSGDAQVGQQDEQAFGREPEYLEERVERISGARLKRISDTAVFAAISSGRPTHQYSRRQSWNAGMSLLEVGNALLDADTYQIVNPEIQLSTARVWSHTEPHLMYGIYYGPEPNILASWNVRTDRIQALIELDGHTNCSFGNQEGNLSINEKVVVACDHKYSNEKHLIAIDLRNKVQLGQIAQDRDYNWAGYSESGNYIIVENNAPGSSAPSELLRYNARFRHRTPLGRSSHGDFGRDADTGEDIYAMIRGNGFEMIQLSDGYRQYLELSAVSSTGGGHLSCRSTGRPGWCYFSSYGNEGQLGAVRFSSKFPDIEIWGYHRSSSGSYAAQPKATVSPDGKKILFTSDWYGYGQTTDYVLEIE